MFKPKIIHIGNDQEQYSKITTLFNTNIRGAELIHFSSCNEAVNYITTDDDSVAATIIDLDIRTDLSELFTEINEINNFRPIYFLGDKKFNNRAPQNIFKYNINNEIINIPYDTNLFKEIINSSINIFNNEKVDQDSIYLSKNDLREVSLKFFYSQNISSYDVYVESRPRSFYKLIKKDDKINQGKLISLAKKGINVLHIYMDEEEKYILSSLKHALKLVTKPPTILKESINSQLLAVELITNGLKTVGVTEESQQATNSFLKNVQLTYDRFYHIKDIIALLDKNFHRRENRILRSYYIGIGVLKNLNMYSEIARSKIGMASLIADIYVKDTKEAYAYTQEEYTRDYKNREEMELHTSKARDLALSFSTFNEIDFLVYEHHERPDGKGYPARKNSFETTLLSAIFIVSHFVATKFSVYPLNEKSKKLILTELKKNYEMGVYRKPINSISKLLNYK